MSQPAQCLLVLIPLEELWQKLKLILLENFRMQSLQLL
jgi:hypothetical protein